MTTHTHHTAPTQFIEADGTWFAYRREVPTTITGMAADEARLIRALGVKQVDVLGFSIGGLVTQELATFLAE